MPSRKQLLKAASILREYLPLIEALEKRPEAEAPRRRLGAGQTRLAEQLGNIYDAGGFNLLARGTGLNKVMQKHNRIKNTKMVKSAKNLSIDFEEFGLTQYADFFEKNIKHVSKLNGNSRLAPLKEDVLLTCQADIEAFNEKASSFYDNLLVDIFNLGRQHQIIAVPRLNERIGAKKFMQFTTEDNAKFEKLSNALKEELHNEMVNLKGRLTRAVERDYKEGFVKSAIIDNMERVYSKFSYKIEDILRKHCWRSYQYGNLHQLVKDEVRYVAWKTGHHQDDCLGCRAIETGEEVLKTASGESLPHHRNVDTVRYELSDILAIADTQSPSYFCHDDCRCFFIPADK